MARSLPEILKVPCHLPWCRRVLRGRSRGRGDLGKAGGPGLGVCEFVKVEECGV
jgi:hypothetical protein